MHTSMNDKLLTLMAEAGFPQVGGAYLCKFDDIVALVDSLYETDFGGFRDGADAEASAGDKARQEVRDLKLKLNQWDTQRVFASMMLDEAVKESGSNDFIELARNALQNKSICQHEWIPYTGAIRDATQMCRKCYAVK